MSKYDLDAIGILTVSLKPDGTLLVLDGQHRLKALLELGLPEWPVKCHVYKGLTDAQDSALFRRLNDTRRPTAYDDFRHGVREGDPECVGITEIVESVGLHIEDQHRDGAIACVTALRNVYRSSNGRPNDSALRDALETAIAAWGRRADAVEGHIIHGLGLVFREHGDEIDRAVLIKKLAKFPGGPAGLLGRARSLREIRTGTIARLVAAIAVESYNRGKRSGKVASL